MLMELDSLFFLTDRKDEQKKQSIISSRRKTPQGLIFII